MTGITVTAGQTVSGLTVPGGESFQVDSGGTAIDITLPFGAVEFLVGAQSGTTINSGGELLVLSGASVAGTTTITGNFAAEYVESGAIVSNPTIVSGGFGGPEGSGAFQYVNTGGTASNTTIDSGARLFIEGAAAEDVSATINSGGVEVVGDGGTAFASLISGGGTEFVQSEGTASGTVVDSGGVELVQNGAAVNTVVSGGTLDVQSGGVVGGSVTFAGASGTLIIEGTPSPGTLLDGEVVSGFIQGDTIDLSGVPYDPSGISIVNNDQLQIIENEETRYINLNPTQDFAAYAFQLSPDGHGGTDITAAQYTQTPLHVGTQIGIPVALNDQGEVVGSYNDAGGTHGFLFDNGQYTTLGEPLYPSFGLVGIDNAGDVVGTFSINGERQGAVYDNGNYTSIVPAGDQGSELTGVSSSGQIVGIGIITINLSDDFIYDNGSYTIIPDAPDGNPLRLFSPNGSGSDVNDSGWVIGTSYNLADTYLYHDGTFTLISDPLAKPNTTYAAAINNAGEVVGTYTDATHGTQQVFVYSNGTYTTIHLPTAPSIGPESINDSGEIVGTLNLDGESSGFVYQGGTFSVLDSGGALFEVNNTGQIIGLTNGSVPYSLLTPESALPPAPTGLALAPGSDSGTKGDGVTNVVEPKITGLGVAGDTVKLYVDGGTTPVGTGKVAANGSWSVMVNTSLDPGKHTLTATEGKNGATSVASDGLTITIDTTLPAAPSAPLLKTTAPGGSDGGREITDLATPTFVGTAAPDETIRLYNSVTLIGTGKSNAQGQWSIVTSTLAPVFGGVLDDITATATDFVGNTSVPSSVTALTVYPTTTDAIAVGGGNADVVLGAGNFAVSLGGGNVSVQVGAGSSVFQGGDGNDGLAIGGGSDTITLGNGADTVSGSGGNDTITLGNGTDSVTLTSGNDIVSVGSGNSTIWLGRGNDIVRAGGGNDTITVGAGNDQIDGGTGNDTISAGNGHDTISGSGNDVFELGAGRYDISGGGADTLVLGSPQGQFSIDSFDPSNSTIEVTTGFDLGVDNGLATATPQAIGASLFSPNANGTFAAAGNRFAYDQATGKLYYDADGSGTPGKRELVGTLLNDPQLTAANLFFVS